MPTAEPTTLQTPRSGWQTPWPDPEVQHDTPDSGTRCLPLLDPNQPERNTGFRGSRAASWIALQLYNNPLLSTLALLVVLAGLTTLTLPQPQPVSWWILELILEVADV